MPNWNQNPGHPTPMQGNGSFVKWENRNPVGKAPRTDPVGKVYQDSVWVWSLKTNARYLAKNMPLLSEFRRYGDGKSHQKMGGDVI